MQGVQVLRRAGERVGRHNDDKMGPSRPIRQAITYSRLVDLSHTVHQQVPVWPGDPPVEFDEVAQLGEDGYFLRRFSMGEHSATHMNAPKAFYPSGHGIDAYGAASLVTPAVVVDVRRQVAGNACYEPTPTDVLAWEKRNGRITEGSIVLLYTGWQSKWDDVDAYLGVSPSGKMAFPGFGTDAAQLLINDRGVAGLGIDAPGLDPGRDTGYSVNKLVLRRSGVALESLTNLDLLPPIGITLVIGIIRLKGGSGSPASVLAFVE